ncbi:MAG: VF530 family DNA-binding protein [Gammaproteobacteria bacterium]|nr:VF530 family DNA-binding protein [Gammaproteobacteria bacterium]
MSNESNYLNHPLRGLGLKSLLTEIIDHYGFEILDAYLNLNCFKTKPSLDSSINFLKKTDWAREKVENFYLYEFKNLPRPSSEQLLIPPRERIIPEGQEPSEPKILTLKDAELLYEKRPRKSTERNTKKRSPSDKKADPWAKARQKK